MIKSKETLNNIVLWVSPALFIIISYFIKRDLEEIRENQKIMIAFIPEYREKVAVLQSEIHDLKETTKDHDHQIAELNSKIYFLKPEDIRDPKSNDHN